MIKVIALHDYSDYKYGGLKVGNTGEEAKSKEQRPRRAS
jgi:hypothetical protein